MHDFDVLVIGSGPCGAMLASSLVEAGRSVLLLDYGQDDAERRALIPDRPFSDLRRTDPDQARYFLGEALQGVPRQGIRVGAQLTPARQFVHARTDDLLPVTGDDFQPMQSLALGGLGSAWGTACFTFSEAELARIGLSADGFDRFYRQTVARVGVSVGEAAQARWWHGVPGTQPGLEIDQNASDLLRRYQAKRSAIETRGFFLGSAPLAVLSRDLGARRANPYHDMDFYGEARKSAYRPRYTVEELRGHPNFHYVAGVLALSFREDAEGVTVTGLKEGVETAYRAKRLALCAGALNSARLALRSLPETGSTTTLLCNPYTYFPTIQWSRFGRATEDRRHSLAQLAGYLEGDDPSDGACSVQVYSYRSLLLFKLVKEMPLPAWAGLQVARALVNSMAIFGAWFADGLASSKTMTLGADRPGKAPSLAIRYALTPEETARRRRLEKKLKGLLPALGCQPIGQVDPGAAGSIHYAGTIPFANPVNPRFFTAPDYRLAHLNRVFVGDNASWNWLPHKGPTFTAMANARRVGEFIHSSL